MLFTFYSYYFCTLYLQMHIMKAVVGLKKMDVELVNEDYF